MKSAEYFEEERAAIAEEYRLRNNEGEMKQRKANKQCFDLTKSVLLNAPFTISEFKELTGIINKRQSFLEREAEWTKQMRSEGEGQAAPPSLPDITLRMIFSFLPTTEDLLSCRLVSHDWMSAASKELRKRVCKSFYFYKPPRPGKEDLQKLLKTMNKSRLLPLNSFRLKIKSVKKEKHLTLMENFFGMFAPILQNLFLDFTRFKYQDGPLEPPRVWIPKEMNFENLLNLRVDFFSSRNQKSRPHSYNQDTRTNFTTAYFASTRNLQKLTFQSFTLSELVTALENSPLPDLKNLVLKISRLYDKELENLGGIVKLRSLSLKSYFIKFESKSESMKGFLESQSKSLEYLKLFGYCVGITDFAYEFPRMEKLKVLAIQNVEPRRDNIPLGLRFAGIDWMTCFPELREFQMCDMNENCRDTLFPLDTESVHLGLKTIALPLGFHQITLFDSLPVIARIFPNVQTVKISVQDLLSQILSNWFPNLQKIVLRFDDREFVDEMEEDGDDDVSRVERFLRVFAWRVNLSPQMKDYFNGLSELAFEIKSGAGMDEMETEPENVRRTYDCTWFLRLVRQRTSLEEMKSELVVRRKEKKRVVDSRDESETSDDDLCSDSDLSDGDMERSDDASDDGS